MIKRSRFSRRDFLRGGSGIAAGAVTASVVMLEPLYLSSAPRPVPPSDTIRFGIIGVGMRGSTLLRGAITHPGAECAAACDLYDGRHILAHEIVGKSIPVTRDYRDLLDNKEIDCIINATPDHWHKQIVMDCLAAGKDVYCEKPMTHAVDEGFEIIAAASKNKRIVQVGSQRVSSVVYAKAKELIDRGAIGKVHTVLAERGVNSPEGAWEYPPPPDLSPQNLDWDTWLGTAPKLPFDPFRFARWRCWQAYGSGVAGDLMVHSLSGIHFVGGLAQPPRRALATGGIFRFKDGRDVPDVHHVLFDYPQFIVTVMLNQTCSLPEVTKFCGSGGILEIRRNELSVTTQDGTNHKPGGSSHAFPKALRQAYEKKWHEDNDERLARLGAETVVFRAPSGFDEDWAHMQNFFDSVRTRKPVVEDAAFGNNAAIACHMANTSYFQKSAVRWDRVAQAIRS